MQWFESLPRQTLGHWPTPLEPLERLSAELGGPRIWAKRDDCSGLATGGNKTRKLEYLLADALQQDANVVVTFGAVQSNHARQTAAACAKLGIPCHLVLTRRVDWAHPEYETNANMLIDDLCGAQTHLFDLEEVESGSSELLARLHKGGLRPYIIPAGGSNTIGALGYVRCALELAEQTGNLGIALDKVVHASASSGTQAGLVFGMAALGVDPDILGINVFHPDPQTLHDRVIRLANAMATQHRQVERTDLAARVHINHAYFGGAYGRPTAAAIDAIRMAASLEGLLFDPVYSGKALAALIDQVTLGNFDDADDVILIHTGGAASLPVYRDAFD